MILSRRTPNVSTEDWYGTVIFDHRKLKMEECTIFTCRDVDLYKIPPRQARGHVSGDWQISDRIFTGTCRVVENSKDGIVSIRLEDSVR